ncbi:MAG TPA: hypothetical protein ENI11_01975 [Actinobacteria bacterium]|nr:hypothetical protein [Actinomycetota bacterium]
MKMVNVIIIGPSTSGKSSFIGSLTESVFTTPEEISAGGSGKSCLVEFGRIQMNDDLFLYLVGIPGDEEFQFIWERMAQDLLGFVVMNNTKNIAQAAQVKALIKDLKALTDTPFVVAFNGLDGGKAKAAELKKEFKIPREEQVICCDVTDKESAKKVLLCLFGVAVKQIKKATA